MCIRDRSKGVDRLRLPAAVAQGGADAGHQLHHAEGLGDVVVRPAVQAHHLVVLGPLGGDQDDGEPSGGGAGADALEDVQAVLLREHQVQQDQGGELPLHGGPELGGQFKALRLHALAVQGINDQLADAGVVFQKINHG